MTTDIEKKDQNNIVRFESLRGDEVSLNVSYVQQYFCPEASPMEAFGFIQFCKAHGLNPFLRDAYLVKYKPGDAAQMIVGYHVWLQRASLDPKYQGCRQGLILRKESGLEYRVGAFYDQGETVAGGWAEVFVEGRTVPVRVEVALHEYIQRRNDGTPNRFWKDKPGTMIQKVALAQGHRLAYPSLYAGMYDESESGPGGLPTDPIVMPSVEAAVIDVPANSESANGQAGLLDNPESSVNRLRKRVEGEGMKWPDFLASVLGAETWDQWHNEGGTPRSAWDTYQEYLKATRVEPDPEWAPDPEADPGERDLDEAVGASASGRLFDAGEPPRMEH